MSEDRRRRPRPGPTLWLGVAAVLAMAAGCGDRATAAAGGAEGDADAVALDPEDVAVAATGTVERAVVLTGSLTPWRTVNLSAQVPGTLSRLTVDRGSRVHRGQVLASIEAEGVVGQAEGSRAGVAAAEAALALARQRLEAADLLHGAGAMSDLDHEGARAALEAAQAQLAAARAGMAAAGEAERRATLLSPLDGAVSERWVTEGEPVAAGQPLLTVVDVSVLELEGSVAVEEATRVRPGMPVVFELASHPDRTFEGVVDRVEPTADPDTRQVRIYARLPNPDGSLLAGLFARGRVVVEAARDVVLVPDTGLRGEGDDRWVWVVEVDGCLHRRDVTPGLRDPARSLVAVTTGLTPGEVLLVSPAQATEGLEVRLPARDLLAPTVTAGAPATPVDPRAEG